MTPASGLAELANYEFVWQRWYALARAQPDKDAIVHWVYGEPPYRWSFGHLLSTAERIAARLRDEGVRADDVCAILLRHHRLFYPMYLGVCLLGAIPSVLAYPNNRLHPEKFRSSLEGMARKSGLAWVVMERELEDAIRPLALVTGTTVRGFAFPFEWEVDGASDTCDETFPAQFHRERIADSGFLLQHSSGTTGLQKGVALSHRDMLEHIARYGEALHLRATDKVASWLPLYHDMGLVAAFHLPLMAGLTSVQMSPFEWVMSPVLWAEVVSSERATLSWLPNFAYNHMADRIHEDDLADVSLATLRMVINCSEPVRADSHEKFLARFRPCGLKPEAIAAAYAIAEATFALTQTEPGTEARRVVVDRTALSQGFVRLATGQDGNATRTCVSSGVPVSGCDLRILGDDGSDLPDDRVGEIALRSVSLFKGYVNNPEKTAEVLRNGWYHSGDLGFRHEHEYYVIGRKNDVIIVAGKNIYPEDIEDAVSQVAGILPGRVVAFGENDNESGTEQIYVIAETPHTEPADHVRLRRAVVEVGMSINLTVSEVVLVEPRWLIKSSAGKPSRRANKDRSLARLAERRSP